MLNRQHNTVQPKRNWKRRFVLSGFIIFLFFGIFAGWVAAVKAEEYGIRGNPDLLGNLEGIQEYPEEFGDD